MGVGGHQLSPCRRWTNKGVAVPRVYGIIETSLFVKDPQKSAEFYQHLFDVSVLLESDRLIALDVAGKNVLLLFKEGAASEPFVTPGGVVPGHAGAGQSHVAFSIASEDVSLWKERLKSAGVAVESVVKWPAGAESLYFRDPDGHLIELITPGFWRIYW
jgi:catechol 2,3-dioxygenase-like lactoylglutathione lyase family enzyme